MGTATTVEEESVAAMASRSTAGRSSTSSTVTPAAPKDRARATQSGLRNSVPSSRPWYRSRWSRLELP